MLEEKEGWISSEAPRHDIEMLDFVIEVMAKSSQQTSEEKIQLFRPKNQ